MPLLESIFQQSASFEELKQSNIECHQKANSFFKGGIKASTIIYAFSTLGIFIYAFLCQREFLPLFLFSTMIQFSAVVCFSFSWRKLFSLSPVGNQAEKRHLMAQAAFLPFLQKNTFQQQFVNQVDALAREFGREYHNSYHYAGITRNELDSFKNMLIDNEAFNCRKNEVLEKFETLCVLSGQLESMLQKKQQLTRFESISDAVSEKEYEMQLAAKVDPVNQQLVKML
jgi:hypothetical protein